MVYQYGGDKPAAPEPATAARRGAPKTADKLEDLEYLISAGCSVDDALKRSGYRALASFKRAALRHGRTDLIRHVSDRLAS